MDYDRTLRAVYKPIPPTLNDARYSGIVAAWDFQEIFKETLSGKKLNFSLLTSSGFRNTKGEFTEDRHGNYNSAYQVRRGVTGKSIINSLPIGNQDRTYMFWYRKNKCEADIPLLVFGNWTKPRSGVFIRARECDIYSPHMTISFEPDLNGKHKHTDGGNKALYSGEWNHVVITYSKGRVMFYFNGNLISSGGSSNDIIDTATKTAEFGWVTWLSSKAKGDSSDIALDDIRVFSKSLSAKQVSDIYKLEKPSPPRPQIEIFREKTLLKLKSKSKLDGYYQWEYSKDLKNWKVTGTRFRLQNSITEKSVNKIFDARYYRLKVIGE
jgi:hypothetical protein